ncbi:unnamed protein product [Pichia kudriavzevii]
MATTTNDNNVKEEAPISIQALEAGEVDVGSVCRQLESLESLLGSIRSKMVQLLETLATADATTALGAESLVAQQAQESVAQLIGERATFLAEYRRLMPLVRYCKIKMGLSPDQQKVAQHHVV